MYSESLRVFPHEYSDIIPIVLYTWLTCFFRISWMRVRSPIKQHAKLTYTEILIPRTSFTTSSALSSRVRTFICTRDFFYPRKSVFPFPLTLPHPLAFIPFCDGAPSTDESTDSLDTPPPPSLCPSFSALTEGRVSICPLTPRGRHIFLQIFDRSWRCSFFSSINLLTNWYYSLLFLVNNFRCEIARAINQRRGGRRR